jgi:hypothetical protein
MILNFLNYYYSHYFYWDSKEWKIAYHCCYYYYEVYKIE